jgi:hypothetical protein
VALSGHSATAIWSPLSGVKRTSTNRCSSTSIYEYTPSSLVRSECGIALHAPICGAASVPIPKFARFIGTLSCELRNQRDTRKYIILVRFLDLKSL